MHTLHKGIEERIGLLPPISLEEMSGIKLMNRTDTKFVTTFGQLLDFLSAVKGEYYIQEINGKRIARYHTTYFDTDDYQMNRASLWPNYQREDKSTYIPRQRQHLFRDKEQEQPRPHKEETYIGKWCRDVARGV